MIRTLLILLVMVCSLTGYTRAEDSSAGRTLPATSPELADFLERLRAGKNQTVIVYGTSLTEGGGWTGALRAWLNNQFPGKVKFVNSGLSGKNSDEGLAQLKTRVLDHRPDLVFVEFAINDAHTKFKMPVEKAATNLDQIVKSIRAQNPQAAIVLQVMNPTWDVPNGNLSSSNRPQYNVYNDNYRNYARDHKMMLLDHWVNWQKLQETEPEKFKALIPDGTHPNTEGSLAVTWPLVRSILQPVSAAAPTSQAAAPTPPVTAAPTLPAAPLGVAMTANSAGSITLSWYRPQNNDVTAYNVYGSTAKDGEYKRLTTVTERSVTLNRLPGDTKFFYKVSAVNALGEGALSTPADAFTIKPAAATPLPVRVAKNMCVSLGGNVVSDSAPISGKLADLVDGSDTTTCRLRRISEFKIQLNDTASFADADYLLVHFRAHGGTVTWSNDPFARTLRNYTIIESLDSTDGKDGTWQEVVSGTNDLLDGVITIPNHKPKWIGVRSSGGAEIVKTDRRPMPSDLLLSRFDVFRSAPKGFRNDYWIFTGDSLVVQDMPAGGVEGRSAYFSDLIRKQHPDRYPIVVHAARGGEIMPNTIGRMKNFLPVVAGPNGTDTPTGTFLCFETGFNDVGLMAGLWTGEKVKKNLTEAQQVCKEFGLLMVPVRIEFSTGYLDMETLEPKKYNLFHNTLAVNLAGVDVFARESTPYAVDPKTQLPYADYWTYTRDNYANVLVKDGVHHTKEGADGINRLWAEVADKMVYSQQK